MQVLKQAFETSYHSSGSINDSEDVRLFREVTFYGFVIMRGSSLFQLEQGGRHDASSDLLVGWGAL